MYYAILACKRKRRDDFPEQVGGTSHGVEQPDNDAPRRTSPEGDDSRS